MNTIKKLIMVATLVATSLLQASEYILYKEGMKDNKKIMLPLNEKEHTAAYEVLINYQFPMSLCSNATQELSAKELAALDANEEQFLQSKMPAGVKVAFIPKVLYELLFLKFYMDDAAKARYIPWYINSYEGFIQADIYPKPSEAEYEAGIIDSYTKRAHRDLLGLNYGGWKYRKDLVPHTKSNNAWDQEAYHRGVYYMLLEDFTRNIHQQLNTRILTYLQPTYLQTLKDTITQLTQDIITLVKQSTHDQIQTIYYLKKYMQAEHADLFYTVAIKEIEAHKNNAWLLYRGVNPLSATCIDATSNANHFHSNSYGPSFLGGIIGDCSAMGTVPYFYAINRSFGYACMVSKADYRQQKLSHDLFFIPPFNTVTSWGLQGEFTHPRTKVHTSAEQAKEYSMFSLKAGGINGPRELPIECLFADKQKFKTAAALEATFQKYVAQHIRIIKDDRETPSVAATATTSTAATPFIKSKL